MGNGFKEVASLRGDDKKYEDNFSKIDWGQKLEPASGSAVMINTPKFNPETDSMGAIQKALDESFTVIKGNWYHPMTKGTYEVIGPVKIKVAVEGRWVDGILYKDPKTNEQYVRSKENFLDRFVKVK